VGRVFSYHQVVNRQVPSINDFNEGKRDIWQAMESCDDIVGAIVCGSIIHGTQNLRSDIDLVIYYHDTPVARSVIAGLRERCHQRNLDLAIVLVDTVIAKTRFHTISYGFYQHLSNVVRQGGLIKHNFLLDLKTDFYDAYSDAAEYLSFKLRYVGKAIDDLERVDINEQKHLDVLQKGLEVAINAVRSLLDLKGIDLVDDSKAAVVEAYGRIAPAELAQQLRALLELDQEYTQELGAQLYRPHQERYQALLDRLAASLPVVKEFIRQNAFWIEREHEGSALSSRKLHDLMDQLPQAAPTVS
jgi:predicted nucleotidyltransferase